MQRIAASVAGSVHYPSEPFPDTALGILCDREIYYVAETEADKTAIDGATTRTILTADNALHGDGLYQIPNDTWGKGALVNGVDFTSEINVVDSMFPLASHADWDWPARDPAYSVSSYLATVFGSDHRDASGNVLTAGMSGVWAPTRIDDIVTLSMAFDITVDSESSWTALYECFLFNDLSCDGDDITHEIGILGHHPFSQSGATGDSVTVLGQTAPLYLSDPGWDFILATLPEDALSGTIDVRALFTQLKTLGYITGQEYWGAFKIGIETYGGSGSVTWNNVSGTFA